MRNYSGFYQGFSGYYMIFMNYVALLMLTRKTILLQFLIDCDMKTRPSKVQILTWLFSPITHSIVYYNQNYSYTLHILFHSKTKITLFHLPSFPFIRFHSLYHSLSFAIICYHSFYHSLSLAVIRCHSQSFVVTRCHFLSLVVTCYHLLSLVVTHCFTRFHSLYHLLSLFVIRCHLLSFVVTRCTTLCHLLSLNMSLVCLFMNDPLYFSFL